MACQIQLINTDLLSDGYTYIFEPLPTILDSNTLDERGYNHREGLKSPALIDEYDQTEVLLFGYVNNFKFRIGPTIYNASDLRLCRY